MGTPPTESQEVYHDMGFCTESGQVIPLSLGEFLTGVMISHCSGIFEKSAKNTDFRPYHLYRAYV